MLWHAYVSLGTNSVGSPKSIVMKMKQKASQCNACKMRFSFVKTELTVTGASTLWTLLSSTRISLALKHRALTSPSRRYSHRLSRSICSSREELHIAPPPAPVAGVMAAVAPECSAEAEADVEGAPTDAATAGVTGATAADAMVLRSSGVSCGKQMRGEREPARLYLARQKEQQHLQAAAYAGRGPGGGRPDGLQETAPHPKK